MQNAHQVASERKSRLKTSVFRIAQQLIRMCVSGFWTQFPIWNKRFQNRTTTFQNVRKWILNAIPALKQAFSESTTRLALKILLRREMGFAILKSCLPRSCEGALVKALYRGPTAKRCLHILHRILRKNFRNTAVRIASLIFRFAL